MEFGPGGGVKKCCAEEYTLLYLSVPPFSFPRTPLIPSMPLFSRKARSAPKRQSSRRVAPKAPKGLSARAKSTIRKTIAAIAGLGGAAALTYAGLFLANQKQVNACLKTGNKENWDKIHCDSIMKSMITPKNSKTLLKNHKEYRISGKTTVSAHHLKKEFDKVRSKLRHASQDGEIRLHEATAPSVRKYQRNQLREIKSGKRTLRKGRARSAQAEPAPSHIKNAAVVEDIGKAK